MAKRYGTTGEIVGKRVLLDKSTPKKPEAVKRLGKVRHCVFHPTQRRFVGFIVKRPDLLWMFRRKDVFVAYNGYDVVDGRIVVSQAPEATGKGACKAMGVNYDDCVLWAGLPVMGEDGTVYLAGLLKDAGLAPSAGEARRLIDGGGVKIDGEAVAPKSYNIDSACLKSGVVLQVGKRKFARLA